MYMSSEFADKAKHSNASLALHKAQLKDTQASLARIKYRHVFRLMDLPEELMMKILVMLVRNECNLGEFHYRLPAIAATGNQQLRLETLLAALQNNILCTIWQNKSTLKWLSKVSFSALQNAGLTCPRNGLSAIRTVDISRCSGRWTEGDRDTTRLLVRLKNLRDLLIVCNDAKKMFEIGSDYSISGDALGAEVRECNLDLPSLHLPSLRKMTITMRFDHEREEWMRNVGAYVPDWEKRIRDGCERVARWLSEEYGARGLRVIVDMQTEID